MVDEQKVSELLTRGVGNIIPGKDQLRKKLLGSKKLNVYLGIDPTATRIHIGHAILLRKLQMFVEMGHNVTFLIGDFTALIGDTSDKDSERPILTKEEIQKNFKTYKGQAEKILDFTNVNVKNNSEWLKDLTFEDIVQLTQNFSVGDFVSRELIRKRLDDGKRVRLDEMLYPIMQGYDSYHLDTDVQIGGADQTFNMQAGRTLQKNLRNKESFVLVNDYLLGTDGRKMSKSWGNAIWLTDEPNDMYGKLMSIKDELIPDYFTMSTSLPMSKVTETLDRLESGENPLSIKKELAFVVVSELHGEKEALEAQNFFEETFQKGKFSDDALVVTISNPVTIVEAIAETVGSKSEAKRLVDQKALEVNGSTITDFGFMVKGGEKIKIGKKTFVEIKKQ